MTSNSSSTSLSDVLYAFSLAKEVPDAGLLEEFVRRYPEHAAALTDFAVEVALDAAQPSEEGSARSVETKVSPTVSRVMSRFQNRMFAARQSEGGPRPSQGLAAPPLNPLSALTKAEFRELATRLNANSVFLMKIRDRQIEPATVPAGFSQRLAVELLVPPEVIASHFAAPPEMPTGAYYKSDQKPQVAGRQTFEEAVRNSGLSDEQQNSLLAM
jgi:hypothetical protein